MRIPPSNDVRFHSITQAFQQDEDPMEPDSHLAVEALFCAVGLLLLVWISWMWLA